MYDTVRWVILIVLFAGLLGLWLWSKRQAAGQNALGKNVGSAFKVVQKRWLDQRTGVCLIEAEDQSFLLAYTVGGGVSWQPVEKAELPEPPIKESIEKMVTERARR
ncbi:MAG TPA: flagellar biosynthetic protein FliO [Candidatus Methylacidiphilales bacterium]|nr:flagellar biosynthetic protein FliO [Candidatus Methylacidiphilales bacterium]